MFNHCNLWKGRCHESETLTGGRYNNNYCPERSCEYLFASKKKGQENY